MAEYRGTQPRAVAGRRASLPISGLGRVARAVPSAGRLRRGRRPRARRGRRSRFDGERNSPREAGAYVIGRGGAAGPVRRRSTSARRSSSTTSTTTPWRSAAFDLVFDVIGAVGSRSAGLIRAGGTLRVHQFGPAEARPADGLAVDFVVKIQCMPTVRWSGGCRTGADWGANMRKSHPSTDCTIASFESNKQINGKRIMPPVSCVSDARPCNCTRPAGAEPGNPIGPCMRCRTGSIPSAFPAKRAKTLLYFNTIPCHHRNHHDQRQHQISREPPAPPSTTTLSSP